MAAFVKGDIVVVSNRVFTANKQLIAYKAGNLTTDKTNEVIAKLIAILQQ